MRPLVSIACLAVRFHLLRSWAILFGSCSPVLHQLKMSSIRCLHGPPLLFVPSAVTCIHHVILAGCDCDADDNLYLVVPSLTKLDLYYSVFTREAEIQPK